MFRQKWYVSFLFTLALLTLVSSCSGDSTGPDNPVNITVTSVDLKLQTGFVTKIFRYDLDYPPQYGNNVPGGSHSLYVAGDSITVAVNGYFATTSTGATIWNNPNHLPRLEAREDHRWYINSATAINLNDTLGMGLTTPGSFLIEYADDYLVIQESGETQNLFLRDLQDSTFKHQVDVIGTREIVIKSITVTKDLSCNYDPGSPPGACPDLFLDLSYPNFETSIISNFDDSLGDSAMWTPNLAVTIPDQYFRMRITMYDSDSFSSDELIEDLFVSAAETQNWAPGTYDIAGVYRLTLE